ncbi:MAG: hypothetical protein AAGJ38_02870 [Planctomycetota bacterium]
MKNSHMATFPSTHWSFIDGLVTEDAARRRERVQRFLELYHRPLEQFLAWRFPELSSHDREDILQEFVGSRLLAGDLYEKAIAGRVNFRAYLKVCLKNFAFDQMRRQLRESAKMQDFSADVREETGDAVDPLDIEWANTVMNEAVQRFRRECQTGDRRVMGEVFEARVLRPAIAGERPPSLEALAAKVGRTPKQASNLVVTATRSLNRHLHEIVRGYVGDEAAIEAEIRDLRAALQGHAATRLNLPGGEPSKPRT